MWKSAVVVMTMFLTAPAAHAVTPTASFTYSPPSPLTNETVTFTSTSSGPITSQTWDLDGDRACNDASGATAQRSFPAAGTYKVTLCVSGGTGSSTATDGIVVGNRAPVAAFTYSPTAPLSGDNIVLTSFSADPDGPLTSQAWDLDGDGAFDDGQGSTATVSFAAAGDYAVKLLVTDRDGAASLAVRAIEVRAPLAQFITPFPVVRVVGDVRERGTRIKEIIVRVPAGSRVRIRCRGRGCPRPAAKRTGGVRMARTLHVRRFAHRLLRPRAVLTISITKPGTIGKYTRLRIRRGKPPSRIDRCLFPGAKRPVRCPV
jgi:PKD domain-containing protein